MSIQVSKMHPAIRRLLKPALSKWRGWLVYVEQVDPSWNYRHAAGPLVYRERADGEFYGQVPSRSVGGETFADGPAYGDVLIVKATSGTRWHTGAVTIYIPKLDPTVLDVARDALLGGNKKLTKTVLEQLGPYAGIGGAMVEAQAKRLMKVQKGGKASRQLQREIDEFLRERHS